MAYRSIRDDILSCRLAPGSKLLLNPMAERLGVSLSVVRETASRLAAEGLLIAQSQRGFVVPGIDRDDLIELTDARIEVECLCLREAVRSGNMDWEVDVLSAYHRLEHTPVHSADPAMKDHWAELHAAFHHSLVAGGTNRWYLRIRETLFAHSERYRRLSVALQQEQRDLEQEHKALMEAAIARDAELVCERIRAHLSLTIKILLDAGICEPGAGTRK
ncbi:GntR family transcriptional regulator [Pararhodobacter sp.]|uniref:GntR family transcriptional regulator n=1 Tax=Pararhodobacter sp. TaxID=2127056 RepID=UPI002FDDB2F6